MKSISLTLLASALVFLASTSAIELDDNEIDGLVELMRKLGLKRQHKAEEVHRLLAQTARADLEIAMQPSKSFFSLRRKNKSESPVALDRTMDIISYMAKMFDETTADCNAAYPSRAQFERWNSKNKDLNEVVGRYLDACKRRQLIGCKNIWTKELREHLNTLKYANIITDLVDLESFNVKPYTLSYQIVLEMLKRYFASKRQKVARNSIDGELRVALEENARAFEIHFPKMRELSHVERSIIDEAFKQQHLALAIWQSLKSNRLFDLMNQSWPQPTRLMAEISETYRKRKQEHDVDGVEAEKTLSESEKKSLFDSLQSIDAKWRDSLKFICQPHYPEQRAALELIWMMGDLARELQSRAERQVAVAQFCIDFVNKS